MTDTRGWPGPAAALSAQDLVGIHHGHERWCPFCGPYRDDTYELPVDGESPADGEPARRRYSRAFRLLRVLAKLALLILLLGTAAAGAIVLVTPSAGQALALAQALARSRHTPWPAPPVPARFAQALVATEDHRFYSEPGIDPIALGRVLLADITGGPDQGGSGIEYQLARMVYKPGGTGLGAQTQLTALAVKLGLAYSKQEILALYAEVAYYGQGYYGLQAAACGYFGQPPSALTVTQAALLAGLVNAPSADDPVTHLAAARARQQHVLDRMVATGYLTRGQAAQAIRQPLRLQRGGRLAQRGCPA